MHANVTSPRHHHPAEHFSFFFTEHFAVLILIFVDMLLIGLLHYESLCLPISTARFLSISFFHFCFAVPILFVITLEMVFSMKIWAELRSAVSTSVLQSQYTTGHCAFFLSDVLAEKDVFLVRVVYLSHWNRHFVNKASVRPYRRWATVITNSTSTSLFMYLFEWGANGPYTLLQLPTSSQLTLLLYAVEDKERALFSR